MLLQEASAARPEGPLTMSEEAMRLLVAHRWPGNLRELKNLIQYLAATVGGSVVRPNHLRERLQPGLLSEATELSDEGDHSHRDEPAFRPIADEIRELEAGRIRSALRATGGNKTQAAKLISMPLRTFVGKLKQYQLE
jgi:DNA-binding NtrC family response regulator